MGYYLLLHLQALDYSMVSSHVTFYKSFIDTEI